MQHPFGTLIVKLRSNKWRRYRGQQPAGPVGGGATLDARLAAMANSGGPEGSVLSAFLKQDSLWDYVY